MNCDLGMLKILALILTSNSEIAISKVLTASSGVSNINSASSGENSATSKKSM